MTFERCCFLCLNTNFICVNDEELFEKVNKYLQIDIIALSPMPALICGICIESVEQFHEFYERLRSIYVSRNGLNEKFGNANETKFATPEREEHIEEPRGSNENENLLQIELDEELDIKPIFTVRKTTSSDNDYPRIGRPPKKSTKFRSVQKEIARFYKEVQCPKCENEIVYSDLNGFRRHFKEYHKELPYIKCCEKSFQLRDVFRLRRHMKIHVDPNCCKCDLCGKVLSSPRNMRLHRELHTPETERTIECKECGRKCSGNAELYRHMITIHAPQECVCDICGKNFRRRVTFRAHMRTAHGENKSYVCEICAKTYKAASSLQQHMVVAHSDNYSPKTKQCQICGKWMGAMYVKKHMLRLHDNTSRHDCPFCDKTFKLPADVRSHLVSHSDERPHICSICSNTFKTKVGLRIHMTQHTGGKPVSCPYCGKMISSQANYLAHRRRMHSKQYEKDKAAAGESERTICKTEVMCEEIVAQDCDNLSEDKS